MSVPEQHRVNVCKRQQWRRVRGSGNQLQNQQEDPKPLKPNGSGTPPEKRHTAMGPLCQPHPAMPDGVYTAMVGGRNCNHGAASAMTCRHPFGR